MTTAHLLTYLLPITSTKLGRLTTSAHRPHQNFHDPLPPRPSTTEMHTAHHTNFRETRTFTKRSRLNVGLADLLSLRFTTTSTGAATLAAPQTTTSDLQNSDVWFAEACAQPETQRWMQAAAKRGDSVYLVVGIRSACNATLTSERAGGGSMGVLAVVPGTALVPPEAAVGGRWGGEGEVGMKAVGEVVYAVLYRKVRLRTVFAKSVEGAAVLEGGCRWREVWDWTVSQRERQGGSMRSPWMGRLRSPLTGSYIPLKGEDVGGRGEEVDMGISGGGGDGALDALLEKLRTENPSLRQQRRRARVRAQRRARIAAVEGEGGVKEGEEEEGEELSFCILSEIARRRVRPGQLNPVAVPPDCDAPKSGPERPQRTLSALEKVIAEKHHKIEINMLPFPFPEDIGWSRPAIAERRPQRTRPDLVKAVAERQNTISNDMWLFPGQDDIQRSRPVIPEAPPLPTQADMGAPPVQEEGEVHWEASLDDDEWWVVEEDVEEEEEEDIYSLISDGEGWQL